MYIPVSVVPVSVMFSLSPLPYSLLILLNFTSPSLAHPPPPSLLHFIFPSPFSMPYPSLFLPNSSLSLLSFPHPFHRPFHGLITDVKKRYPKYWSDIKDAFSLQVLASIIFIFFANITPAVTFGGVLGGITNGELVSWGGEWRGRGEGVELLEYRREWVS